MSGVRDGIYFPALEYLLSEYEESCCVLFVLFHWLIPLSEDVSHLLSGGLILFLFIAYRWVLKI